MLKVKGDEGECVGRDVDQDYDFVKPYENILKTMKGTKRGTIKVDKIDWKKLGKSTMRLA